MKPITDTQQLPPQAVQAWRVYCSIWCFFLALVPLALWLAWLFGSSIPLWVSIGSTLVVLALAVLLIGVAPKIRWRQLHYKIDQHELHIQRGIWVIRRTLVPVKRVQHVDTRQGPILHSYDLADVVISTAATTHKIPALDENTADQLRQEISTFARIAKEDV